MPSRLGSVSANTRNSPEKAASGGYCMDPPAPGSDRPAVGEEETTRLLAASRGVGFDPVVAVFGDLPRELQRDVGHRASC